MRQWDRDRPSEEERARHPRSREVAPVAEPWAPSSRGRAGAGASRALLALQRDVGNRAVAAVLAGSFLQRVPPVAAPVAPPVPVKIGYIYTVRGTINGKAVVYSGQTAREVAQRLYKDKHTWSALIKDKATTIEVHEIKAVLNVAESGRGTPASAKKEALSSAEQVIVKRRRAELTAEELNEIDAAEEANIVKWAERHEVQLGPRITFRAGVKVAGFAAFQLLDLFLQYRDDKLSHYAMAPYLLEDESGVFTLQEHDRGIFRPNHYFKVYKFGARAGQTVQVSKQEFRELQQEAELLWGTTDWKGDFVPGLLRQELPVIEVDPNTTA